MITAKIRNRLIDENYRYRIQMVFVPIISGIIALVMSAMNYMTKQPQLMWATITFGVVSFACAILSPLFRNKLHILYIVYMIAALALIVDLLVYGGAQGVSAIWICLFPSFGMLFWGKRDGFVFSLSVFILVVFFMWTPWGHDMLFNKDYTEPFMIRFPLVYLGSFAMGYFFEFTRQLTYDAFKDAHEKLLDISSRDGMTGIKNHAKFTEDTDALVNGTAHHTVGFIYIDINGLKLANDTQSHEVGDKMIYTCVDVIKDRFGADACYRMGGDEFIVMLVDCPQDIFEAHLKYLHKTYNACDNLSVAIGSSFSPTTTSVDMKKAVMQADADMQREKIVYYKTSGIDRRSRRREQNMEQNNEA